MTRQDMTGDEMTGHDWRGHDTRRHDRPFRRAWRASFGEVYLGQLADWQRPWPYGPPQECSWAQSAGCHWGPSPIRTRDWNARHHFPSRLPSPSPAPAPTPAAAPAPIHTPAPGNFQTQKYISSPSSRSSKYLPFVDATSPKPRKALHSAVVLRMRPCTKIHVSRPAKNVVKNLSLP